MEGPAGKCVERYCELKRVSTTAGGNIVHGLTSNLHLHFSTVQRIGTNLCGMKCMYVARSGRLDLLWMVNKLARSVTK